MIDCSACSQDIGEDVYLVVGYIRCVVRIPIWLESVGSNQEILEDL